MFHFFSKCNINYMLKYILIDMISPVNHVLEHIQGLYKEKIC